MKILRNKKGAALVSVLIGILFIAILASSLLYMSTMNFEMKSMHQFSTDNFYSAEYALDDMVAQLKQFCSIQSDPHGELENLLKTSGGGCTIFNEGALLNLIDIGTYVEGLDPAFGTNGVEVTSIYKTDTGYSQDTYVDDGTYIHLRGVQVTVKTDEAHGNYKSTITTDIDLAFPAKGGSTAGLNDFSILTDSCIYVNGGSQHFCGDMYCRKNGQNGSKALQVGNHTIVSCMGGFNFFDGDVQVDDGGSLFIAGNCYINGKVTVASTGQLIIGGTVYVRNDVSGGTPRVVRGGALNTHVPTTTVDWDFYDDEFGDGLAGKLVAETMHLHLGSLSGSMSLYGFNGDADDFFVTQEQFRDGMQASTNENGKVAEGTTPDGRPVKAVYLTNGVTHEMSNTLILSPIATTATHGNTPNCTWLITCNDDVMEIGEGGGVAQYMNVWGNMDDVSYEAAKKLFFKADWPTTIGGKKPIFGGAGYSANDLVSDDGTLNGTEWTLDGDHLHYYTHGNSESQRYYYQTGIGANSDMNYFTYECFLDSNIATTLGKFKNGMPEEGTGNGKPTIILNNWTKD